MPSITGAPIVISKDNGSVVLNVTRSFNFIGATVTTSPGGEVNVDVGGGGGGGWALVGNALVGGEVLGSTNNQDVVFVRGGTERARLGSGNFDINQGRYLFDFANASYQYGRILLTGTITAAGQGSYASGRVDNAAFISANGNGSKAFGNAVSGSITAQAPASFAFGFIPDTGSGTIDAQGNASLVFGAAVSGSTIVANSTSPASLVFGRAQNGSQLFGNAQACLVFGSAIQGSQIRANGLGSFASGTSQATAGQILLASGIASTSRGYANAGTIHAQGDGSFAEGVAEGALGLILATATGSSARGYASNQTLGSSGFGAFAGGYASQGSVSANALAAFAYGDNLASNANYGATFGIGHQLSSYAGFICGSYSEIIGSTPGSFVAADPVFLIGGGSDALNRRNVFRVDKDGRRTTVGAHIDSAVRLEGGAVTVSARTDRTIILDSAGAGGNVTLPLGENGLVFTFTCAGAGLGAFTIVPTAPDVLDVNVVAGLVAGDVRRLRFFNGTWYNV